MKRERPSFSPAFIPERVAVHEIPGPDKTDVTAKRRIYLNDSPIDGNGVVLEDNVFP
jgi:hypothetical protein